MGVFPSSGGVEVRVFSRHASRIDFCLLEAGEKRHPLARGDNFVHSAFIAGAKPGMAYGLRADGPYDPAAGHLFDASKLLVDPLALKVDRAFNWNPDFARFGQDTSAIAPRGIISETPAPVAKRKPEWPAIIYELQVKSFSQLNPDIPEHLRGTFAALAHPASLAHFKKLGIDTIEVMPLMAWADERHLAALGLTNAWGYNPYCFGAPEPRLVPGGWGEVQETLTTLHEAGLQVILDVVFNHTGESDLGGPTLSLRGLDNVTYYRHANGQLVNDTGCGNTLATSDPAVISMILQSMQLWAGAGFDGFRYDLATVMGRGDGGFSADAPLLRAIEADPIVGQLIHIAEPWDVGSGGYQLGSFPASWGEWNDHFRDDVRRFWRGDGWAGHLATRLAGSSDIFNRSGRSPAAGINFIAAHDGFSLADCVRFSGKRNHANGEDNGDGNSSEVCWVSEQPARDVRALLATLLLSRGTPMLTAGDEFGRSQRGNNNAYAQDNPITWLDWSRTDRDLIDYVSGLISFRRANAEYFNNRFFTGEPMAEGMPPDVEWLDRSGSPTQWPDGLPLFCMVIASARRLPRLLVAFNRSNNDITVTPPAAQEGLGWPDGPLIAAARSVVWWLEQETPAFRATAASDDDIRKLATAAGIQPDWWEVNGTQHRVSLETQRVLLAAIGLDAKTKADVREHMLALGCLKDTGEQASCYASPELETSRVFGLSAHLYALRHATDWGIGDFETLSQAAEATGAMGGKLIGLNPLHHMFTDDRGRVSPYQPSDRRFIDPIYIDVEALNAGRRKPPQLGKLRNAEHVDYAGVWRTKDKALRAAFATFKGSHAFDDFVAARGEALQQHARFESRRHPGGEPYAMWLQWVADQQLGAAGARAKSSGLSLGIFRDLALGCAYEGGEVWADPQLFSTSVSIGAPPDPFSADGQVWNLPPFNPLELARRDYQPFAEVLRANMRHAGVLRIDHVLGLARQFWVPRGASGVDGAYVTMPVNRLMGVVAAESRKARCAVIGEDLGTVPDGFRERLWSANMLSYRVLWFEQDEHRYTPPEIYPRQAAVCLSSHDLLPFRGREQSLTAHDRERLTYALASATSNSGNLLADAHEFVARTPCSIMLVQADDLTGETEPLNVPGTDKERPNWRRRLSAVCKEIPGRPEAAAILAALRRAGRVA